MGDKYIFLTILWLMCLMTIVGCFIFGGGIIAITMIIACYYITKGILRASNEFYDYDYDKR